MMKFITKFGFAAALTAGIAMAPLAAQSIEEKNIEKGKDKIMADQGYIFMHDEDRFSGMFLKIPSADDIAEYEAEWEEKRAKAYKKYERKAARYDRDVEMARQMRKSIPEKPVEPTAENFSIDPIEFRNTVSFGPMYVYAKENSAGEKSHSYLQQVEPGTYVYYGPIVMAGNGVMGHCLCMGSIQFEVKPGIITNLGNILSLGGSANDGVGVDHDEAAIPPEIDPFPMKFVNFDLPVSLQKYESQKANFHASDKYPNRFGIMISRMRPIEGVLAYDRDRPIDVKARLVEMEAEAAAMEAAAVMSSDAANDDTTDAQNVPANAETASEPAVAEAAEPE